MQRGRRIPEIIRMYIKRIQRIQSVQVWNKIINICSSKIEKMKNRNLLTFLLISISIQLLAMFSSARSRIYVDRRIKQPRFFSKFVFLFLLYERKWHLFASRSLPCSTLFDMVDFARISAQSFYICSLTRPNLSCNRLFSSDK